MSSHNRSTSSAVVRPFVAAATAAVLLLAAACGTDAATPAATPTLATPSAPAANPAAGPALAPPPETPKRPVTDTYHGVAVADDYRWLEDWKDPAVRAWSDAENARTRDFLDRLPGVDAVRARLTELTQSEGTTWRRLRAAGRTLFAVKSEPPKQQPFLVAMDAKDCDPARSHVVVDPNRLDPSGTTSIDFYVPSHDGRWVAVSLSEKGTESGTVHVYDVASGAETLPAVPRVNGGTAGGSVAWDREGTGFWYTRYPHAGERPPEDLDLFQQVWFHRLGRPVEDDRYAIGREFPRIAEIRLETFENGSDVLACVKNGDGGEEAHWLRSAEGAWTQVTRFEDGVVDAALGWDALYLLSRKGAPRGKVLRLADGATSLDRATTVVPEGETAIEWFVPTDTALCVVGQTGGAEDVRVFPLGGGAPIDAVPLPAVASVAEIVPVGDDVLVRSQGYTVPPRWVRVALSEAGRGAKPVGTLVVPLCDPVTVSFDDAEVVRETAVSKDGTQVPLVVVRRKGTKLDGSNPTLLTGYGGYGISMAPRYRKTLRLWLDQGGVFAVASTRGGGEFGEDWHRAGNLTRKQNVFDDFAACARHLVDAGYTRPDRLALEGGSNGGLLMGAMIVQHPDLCRVVVSHVGIYDMLRVETTPNGAFNVTEFGTVKDPDQFRALLAYSPYHHVADGTAYPSVMFLTGANDPRVDPYNSRKMTARLQAANPGGHPILLRTSATTGHGGGTSLGARVEQEADVYAFLLHELGMEFRGP